MLGEIFSIYASVKAIKEIGKGVNYIKNKKERLYKEINELLKKEINKDFLIAFHNMLRVEARRFVKTLVLVMKLCKGEEVDLCSDYYSYSLMIWDELRDNYDNDLCEINYDNALESLKEMEEGFILGDIFRDHDFTESSFMRFLFGLWVIGGLI